MTTAKIVSAVVITLLCISNKIRQISSVSCPADTSGYKGCSGTGTNLESKCTVCSGDGNGHLVSAICSDVKIQCIPNAVKDLRVADAGNPMFQIPFGRFNNFLLRGKTSIETLKINNYGISTLQGACFTACSLLVTLDLRKNKISSLTQDNFRGLSSLQYLTLTQNSFTSIPDGVFQAIPTLKELFFMLNQLTVIQENDFQGLVNLVKLDLQSNNISIIHTNAFSPLVSLEEVKLQGNSLTRLQANLFKNLKNLKIINLQMNKLTSLDPASVTGSPSLVNLNLAQNSLPRVPTQFLQTVANLNLEVNLARNRITTLQDYVFNGLRFATLYLVVNNISSVAPLAFQNCSIEKIDLDQNNIHTLPSGTETYFNQSNLVMLGNNPWSCDCTIQWLVSYQRRMPSQHQQPVCASPTKYLGKTLVNISADLNSECNPTTTEPPSTLLPSTTTETATPPIHPFSNMPTYQTQTFDITTTKVPPEHPLYTPRLNITTNTTTVSTLTTNENSEGDNSSNSTGLIVGIIVAVLIVAGLAGVAVYIRVKRPQQLFPSKVSPREDLPCRVADNNSRTQFTVKNDLVNIIQE